MRTDDARKLDHQAPKAMRAAWRVQSGENPTIIDASLQGEASMSIAMTQAHR
jgi:hypothetical protein